jgi:hypothetical protein
MLSELFNAMRPNVGVRLLDFRVYQHPVPEALEEAEEEALPPVEKAQANEIPVQEIQNAPHVGGHPPKHPVSQKTFETQPPG